MKYKLIREYPGSPSLNAYLDIDDLLDFGDDKVFGVNEFNISSYKDYWEIYPKPSLWYVIVTDDSYKYNPYKIIEINSNQPKEHINNQKWFKTKEEAKEFISLNKPNLLKNIIKLLK